VYRAESSQQSTESAQDADPGSSERGARPVQGAALETTDEGITALEHRQPPPLIVLEQNGNDEVFSMEPGSGVGVSPRQAGSEETSKLIFSVTHRVRGRVRLRVANFRWDFAPASTCLLNLSLVDGIGKVRCDSWSLSAVINYDPQLWTEEKLLSYLSQLTYGEDIVSALPKLPPKREARPITWLRCALLILEKLMPATIQVGLGLSAFVCGFLPVPVALSRTLLLASAAPIACRATRTLLVERKVGIDALDGIAASLMIANGKFIEAGFMTALIAVAELIRDLTAKRCEQLVTDLLGLSGQSAWLVRGEKRVRVAADEVKPGEMVVVYPGDMVPVDGFVTSGTAAIDQSGLTGESVPVEVKTGDKVFASTAVVEGKIYVHCLAAGSETRAGLVLKCITQAPIHETKIENHASAIADKVVLPIFLAAGVCFIMTRNVTRVMSLLILDFCTGMRIAAPTAVLASMNRAGRRGILIKNGAALERLASVTAIVFDKTGTLTSGEPKVEQVSRFNGRTEDEVLALAAAVEMRLHHPAARAIVKAALEKGLVIPERTDSKFSRGSGAKALVGNLEVVVGSKNMMITENIQIDETREAESQATTLGESVSFVAIDGKVAGLIRYRDRLRPEVADSMKALRKLRVKKLIMATGDTEQAANRIAQSCGITEVIARAFPEDKATLVKRLKDEGHTVAVIGDGINDSPALAYADIAISLNGATDAARNSADIILTDDNLGRLPEAIRIARSAMSLIKQNLAMAVIPNGAGFALAGFGLLGPAGATILNNGSAIAAAFNSLRPIYSNTWSTTDPAEKV